MTITFSATGKSGEEKREVILSNTNKLDVFMLSLTGVKILDFAFSNLFKATSVLRVKMPKLMRVMKSKMPPSNENLKVALRPTGRCGLGSAFKEPLLFEGAV